MSTLTPITEIVSSFLDDQVVVVYPLNTTVKRYLVIRDIIHTLLSEIKASTEITNECIKIEVSIIGSYLANKVIPIHPVVKDKDVKYCFFLKEGGNKYRVYETAHAIAMKYLKKHLPDNSRYSSYSLQSVGVLQDSYSEFKNMLLTSIVLPDRQGGLPLELSMVFVDKSFLTHLTNVDALHVPIEVFESELGSQRAREFILCSREGDDVEAEISKLEQRIITSSRIDWNPNDVNYFELARYFIWIIERWTEPGSSVFSCFFEGSITKNSPDRLWLNLNKFITNKRSSNYQFFLLGNFLFHVPSSLALSFLQERPNILLDALSITSYNSALRNVLQTVDGELKPNALFLLSCHLPLLAERIIPVDHLEIKQLQCCFFERGEWVAIVIPIPTREEELLPWMQEICLVSLSRERLDQVISYSFSNIPYERRKFLADEIFIQIFSHLENYPSTWMVYKQHLGDAEEVQHWMSQLFRRDLEIFLRLSSLEKNGLLFCEALRQNIPHMHTISDVYEQKLGDLLKHHVTSHKSWQSLCIRSLIEPASCSPKCLRLLSLGSGVVHNGNVRINLSQFPKLLGTEEKKWVFLLKLSVLFKDSSYTAESFQGNHSTAMIDEIKKAFSEAEILKPFFQSLITAGKIFEAIDLAKLLSRAWGIQELLPWYIELYQRTKFSSVEVMCMDAIREVLQSGESPWRLYALFSVLPTIAKMIEPFLSFHSNGVSPFNLSKEEKRYCLQNLLPRIDELMQELDIESALHLASCLPFLEVEEREVASLFMNLFERSLNRQQQQEIVVLMDQLTPLLIKNLVDRFKSPYTLKKETRSISPHFPLNQWVLIFLSQVREPQYFSLLAEKLEKFIEISSMETLSVVKKYLQDATEEEKERIVLSCSQLLTSYPLIAQEIFDVAIPTDWRQPWTLSSIRKVWNLIKNGSLSIEKKEQFIRVIIEEIPNFLEEPHLIKEMIPYMNHASKNRFKLKGKAEIQKKLKRSDSGKFRSFSIISQEPFSLILLEDISLYQQFVNTLIEDVKKISVKDVEKIVLILGAFPVDSPKELRAKRMEIASLCLNKLQSTFIFPWIAKEAANHLEDACLQENFLKICTQEIGSGYSSYFLQEVAPQLNFIEKKPLFFRLLLKHVKQAVFIDEKTLLEMGAWICEGQKTLQEKLAVKGIKELVLLSLRSNQPRIARDLLSNQELIESNLNIENISDQYLSLISRLLNEYPAFTQNELCIENLIILIASHISSLEGSGILAKNQKLIFLASSINLRVLKRCLNVFCPPLNPESDTVHQLPLLQNHLTLMLTLSEKDLNEITLDLLDPFKQYLLSLRGHFSDKQFSDCAFKLVDLYMKADRANLAITWIQEWNFVLDGASDDNGMIKVFVDHQWTFLQSICQAYPAIIEESWVIDAIRYVKEMRGRFSDPLLEKCKDELVNLCDMSGFGGVVLNKQIVELQNCLDRTNDTEEHLKNIYANCLYPLLTLSSQKEFPLNENFFRQFLDYFQAMKTRMPYSTDLYLCIRSLAFLSSCRESPESAPEYLRALCPPLNITTDGMEQISILVNHYRLLAILVGRVCPALIDIQQLHILVQYVINLEERFPLSSEISEFSHDLVEICGRCHQLELANSLILNIHRNRVIQFSNEKKSINIGEDLAAILEYLTLPGEEWVLSCVEVVQMLTEHKIRSSESNILTSEKLMSILTENIQKIFDEGKVNHKIFDVIMTILLFLINEEGEVSEIELQLAYYAYHSPWIDFSFSKFIEFFLLFTQKVEKQKVVNSTGHIYSIPMKDMIERMARNFQESNLINANDGFKSSVQLLMSLLYSCYKSSVVLRSPSTKTLKAVCREQLVQMIQKIIREKKSWMIFCFLPILNKYENSLTDLKAFIQETDLTHEEKEGGMSLVLIFCSSHRPLA